MLKNYLKIALRNFVKNKVYSGITIMGLAVGMAGTIIIFQLVAHHLSVDRYPQKADKTYRVVVDLHLDDGSVEKERGSAYILHQTLKNEFSSVEHAAYLAHKEVTVAVGSGLARWRTISCTGGWLTSPTESTIAWWMFGLAGLLAAGIALLTVSFQSVKAALMNPVESLRGD